MSPQSFHIIPFPEGPGCQRPSEISQGPESPCPEKTSASGWPAGPFAAQLPKPGNSQAQPSLITPSLASAFG